VAFTQLKQLLQLRRRRWEQARTQVRLAREQWDAQLQQQAACAAAQQQVTEASYQTRLRKVDGSVGNPFELTLLLAKEAALRDESAALQQRALQLEASVTAAQAAWQRAVAEQAQAQHKVQTLEQRVTDLKQELKRAQQQKDQRRMDEMAIRIGNLT